MRPKGGLIPSTRNIVLESPQTPGARVRPDVQDQVALSGFAPSFAKRVGWVAPRRCMTGGPPCSLMTSVTWVGRRGVGHRPPSGCWDSVVLAKSCTGSVRCEDRVVPLDYVFDRADRPRPKRAVARKQDLVRTTESREGHRPFGRSGTTIRQMMDWLGLSVVTRSHR